MYIGGVYEASYSAAGALTGVVTYYPFGGRNVAMRTADGKLHYLLADHLGSTVGVMDASGTVEATQTYWPYGAVRSGTAITQTDRLYTGQRQEPAYPAALGNQRERLPWHPIRYSQLGSSVHRGVRQWRHEPFG